MAPRNNLAQNTPCFLAIALAAHLSMRPPKIYLTLRSAQSERLEGGSNMAPLCVLSLETPRR